MVELDEVNRKINAVIEWLLNDLPLINEGIKNKLLDELPLMSYDIDDEGRTVMLD